METIHKQIAELRILVGFLGEKNQANWWSSDFLNETGSSFLAPIFNNSLFLAQFNGVTAAAAKIHDADIGVGYIYHLFRLPISLEQASAEAFHDKLFTQTLKDNLSSQGLALARLANLATKLEIALPGPQSLGLMKDDLSLQLKSAAGIYLSAFTIGIKSFPYFQESI
jgi:hypothetical protein